MPQDIRDLLKGFKEKNIELSETHSTKFETLLQSKLHQNKPTKKNFKWVSIAASVLLLISLGIKFYPETKIDNLNNTETSSAYKEISLGSISPEFNTIESYYINSINLVMSGLEITNTNQDVLTGYLSKIKELSKEYKLLTQELNTKGVNDNTINALIRNLQLRLQLLQRLKKQLNNLNTQNNETTII
jgi:hypothetical protein